MSAAELKALKGFAENMAEFQANTSSFPYIEDLQNETMLSALKKHGLKLQKVKTVLRTRSGDLEVDAWRFDDPRALGLAVHKSIEEGKRSLWNITHFSSGTAILRDFTQRQQAVLAMGNLISHCPEGFWNLDMGEIKHNHPQKNHVMGVLSRTRNRWT